MDAFANFAIGDLDAAINAAATSADLVTGQGARMPAVPFNLTLWDSGNHRSPHEAYWAGAAEIVRVTARTDDALTITRAQEGTSAVDFTGLTVSAVAAVTAKTLNADIRFPIVTEAGTSRTLLLSDDRKWIRCTNDGNVLVTVPPQGDVPWLDNSEVVVEQGGEGQVTFVGGDGVTVNSTETLKTYGQYAVVALKRVAENLWTLVGEREVDE